MVIYETENIYYFNGYLPLIVYFCTLYCYVIVLAVCIIDVVFYNKLKS